MSKKENKPNTLVRNDKLNLYPVILFGMAVTFVYLSMVYKGFLFGMLFLFLQNIIKFMINSFLLSISLYAVLRLYVVPVWNYVFQDTTELGRKLEWYNKDYRHMTPSTKKLFFIRMGIILVLATIVFSYKIFTENQLVSGLGFIPLSAKTAESALILRMIEGKTLYLLSGFLEFTVVLYFITFLEGRGRVIARIVDQFNSERSLSVYKKPLPPNPFNPKSDEFNLSIFTTFEDEEGKHTFKETDNEQWVTMDEQALRGSILCIGPTGSGKTQAVVLPVLEQMIGWQASSDEKKASIAVYDPKAELTFHVEEIAKKHGRTKDLVILDFEKENYVNPIKVENIWKGDTHLKISGWILSAWINYQGKASPEPYWESQSYLLVAQLLVHLFTKKGNDVTLFDVKEEIVKSVGGCFQQTNNGRILSEFGLEVMTRKIAFLDEANALKELQNVEISGLEKVELTKEQKAKVEEILSREIQEFLNDEHFSIKQNDREVKALMKEATLSASKLGLNVDVTEEFQQAQRLIKSKLYKREKDHFTDEYKANLVKKVYLLDIAEKFKSEVLLTIPIEDQAGAINAIKQSADWILTTWSSMTNEQRGSISSNIQPFLFQFSTDNVKRLLSPKEETVSFDEIAKNGKILVPSFSGIKYGNKLTAAIITLLKARWQHAVLNTDPHAVNKRLKAQIMDEAQELITFGDSTNNTGDFDYMALSRGFGGINLVLTQSLSALEAKAPKKAQFEKISGVINSQIFFPTTDMSTINYIQNIVGKVEREKLSRSMSESMSNPDLDVVVEKFASQSDSMQVSYSISTERVNAIEASDIQKGENFTAIGLLQTGVERINTKLALKPYYYKNKQDKWLLMKENRFQNKVK